jgi:hypothetical protein
MVALQLEHAVLDRSACAASRLQSLPQRSQRRIVESQAPHHSHGLAAAARRLATNANDAVALARRFRNRGADACRERLAAGRAHPPAVGRIDKTAVPRCLAHESILDGSAVVAWQLLVLAMVLSLLGGCAASTRTIVNEKASAEVKAKSFKDDKEILFIPASTC